ncbi:MAG: SGNH/GDSL hydrolase family protein [Bacteroidota bacterium]
MRLFIQKVGIYSTLLLLLNLGLGYFLYTYERDLAGAGLFFPAARWADYYDQSGNIDLLVLGSSHAYRSYDPDVLKRALPGNPAVFNFGSSAQSPLTSYCLLREILRDHQPRLVVLDLYALVFSENNQLNNGRFNLTSMRYGEGQKAFFRDAFSWKEKLQFLLFPSYVYRINFEPKLKKLLGRKYLPKPKGTYRGEGFVFSPDTISVAQLQNYNQFDRFDLGQNALLEQHLEYLVDIKKYCDEREIPLVFFSAPVPEITKDKIDYYDTFSEIFAGYARELNVPFRDANRARFSGIRDAEHYCDDDHLNEAGARLYSQAIVPLVEAYFTEY